MEFSVISAEEVARIKMKERRERIATALMAGLLSNPNFVDYGKTYHGIEKEALEQTDALIKALDEE